MLACIDDFRIWLSELLFDLSQFIYPREYKTFDYQLLDCYFEKKVMP